MDAEQAAKEALDKSVYDFFAGGADDEVTLRASELYWSRIRFLPKILRDVSTVDTTTTFLGTRVSAPIGLAPVGYQGLVHSEADSAVAVGAQSSDVLMTISTRASVHPETINQTAPGGPRWFQTYVLRDRQFTLDLANQAKQAGCTAIVLTADMPVLARRMRDVLNGFTLPQSISSDVRSGAPALQIGPHTQDPSLTFNDIDWLASSVGLPVVVKGVLRSDDAATCVNAGASAIWVSAHGGRQLDGVITPGEALIPIIDSVGSSVEVYVDGGIRKGIDVLKALAMGCTGAFIGRPVVWGLAVGGATGVVEVIEGMKQELNLAMALCGIRSIDEIGRELIKLPTQTA